MPQQLIIEASQNGADEIYQTRLKLSVRCVDSIAAKTMASPGTVVWSYTDNCKSDEIVEAHRCSSSSQAVLRDW